MEQTTLLRCWNNCDRHAVREFMQNRLNPILPTKTARHRLPSHCRGSLMDAERKRAGKELGRVWAKINKTTSRDHTTLAYFELCSELQNCLGVVSRYLWGGEYKRLPINTTNHQKWLDGTWKKVPRADEMINFTWVDFIHQLHVSEDDPQKVAYYPDHNARKRDRPVRTTYGKYLTKYADVFCLSEVEIKQRAEKFRAEQSADNYELRFAEHNDPDMWSHVYEKGPSSCMAGKDSSDITKAIRLYAHDKSELRLAYLYDKANDDIVARTIVRDDPSGEKTGYLRFYPSLGEGAQPQVLNDMLGDAGYIKKTNLIGCLLLGSDSEHGWRCPYIDCGNDDHPSADVVHIAGQAYLKLVNNGFGGYATTETSGFVGICYENDFYCECCGETHSDDARRSTYHGDDNDVCSSCADYGCVWAYYRGSRSSGRTRVREDDAVFCESDLEYYAVDTIDYYDVRYCETHSSYYKADDLTFCEYRNEYVHNEDIIAVDHPYSGSGEVWLYEGDTTELSDGSTCHNDDAQDLEEKLANALEVERTAPKADEVYSIAA